jgi:hypothetical protein
MQKNSHSTNHTVLDTGGSQSGRDALQYPEKLFHVLVVCGCGDHGPMVSVYGPCSMIRNEPAARTLRA